MPIPFQGKSNLQTEDPYHLPGYIGYVPQYKTQFGDTYAHTTHNLLLDKHVSGSTRSVLSEVHYKPPMDYEKLDDLRQHLIKTRTQSWGDQKYQDSMVPGYTGFIPKMRNHYFGKRYAGDTLRSIANFEHHHDKDEKRLHDLRSSVAFQTGREPPKTASCLPVMDPVDPASASKGLPLKQNSKDAAPYPEHHVYPKTVYSMSNSDPKKFLISGYRGYVPREKFLHGRGHKEQTYSAISQFSTEQSTAQFLEKQPIQIEKPKAPSQYEGTVIYPECSGVIPKFYGYVPGEKFRFGQRFGESTKNALKVGQDDSLQPARVYNCNDKINTPLKRSKTLTNISLRCSSNAD